jgi:hypothetical protein
VSDSAPNSQRYMGIRAIFLKRHATAYRRVLSGPVHLVCTWDGKIRPWHRSLRSD